MQGIFGLYINTFSQPAVFLVFIILFTLKAKISVHEKTLLQKENVCHSINHCRCR